MSRLSLRGGGIGGKMKFQLMSGNFKGSLPWPGKVVLKLSCLKYLAVHRAA
jgi:hypothetical protein